MNISVRPGFRSEVRFHISTEDDPHHSISKLTPSEFGLLTDLEFSDLYINGLLDE